LAVYITSVFGAHLSRNWLINLSIVIFNLIQFNELRAQVYNTSVSTSTHTAFYYKL